MPGAVSDDRSGAGQQVRRPLLLTGDPLLLDELLRLAAVAGVEPEVAAEPSAARASWVRCSAVVVGADVAPGCLAARLPRRRGVVLVASDVDDPAVWQLAVSIGAEQAAFLPEAESALIDLLADSVDAAAEPAAVLAVAGGRGGAGATTACVALALAGARAGADVLLLDADPYGGGIDLALGAEDAPGLRWPDLLGVRGRVPSGTLTAGLPRLGALSVVSWDRGDPVGPFDADPSREAVDALLGAGVRGCDLVVADLPRAPGPAAELVVERADLALLVVPAEVRACASAGRTAAWLRHRCADVRVLVRGPAPGGLTATAVAEALGLPLAGWIRAEPGLAAAYERGDVPGSAARSPLARFCRDFVDSVLDARLTSSAA